MAMAMMRRYALRAWGRRQDGVALLMAAIGLAGAAIVLARQSAYAYRFGITSDSPQFIAIVRDPVAGAAALGAGVANALHRRRGSRRRKPGAAQIASRLWRIALVAHRACGASRLWRIALVA